MIGRKLDGHDDNGELLGSCSHAAKFHRQAVLERAEIGHRLQQLDAGLPASLGDLPAAFGFAAAPLLLAWLWAKWMSPQKPGPDKNAVYECGLESKGDAWVQFRSEYYLYAIIFLIFDVETMFLIPWAILYKGWVAAHQGLFALVSMVMFLGILLVGYLWLYKKGALEWA